MHVHIIFIQAGTFTPVNDIMSNILLWLEPAALLRASDRRGVSAAHVVYAEAIGE